MKTVNVLVVILLSASFTTFADQYQYQEQHQSQQQYQQGNNRGGYRGDDEQYRQRWGEQHRHWKRRYGYGYNQPCPHGYGRQDPYGCVRLNYVQPYGVPVPSVSIPPFIINLGGH